MAEQVTDRARLRILQAERRRNPAIFLRDGKRRGAMARLLKRRGMMGRLLAFLCQPGRP